VHQVSRGLARSSTILGCRCPTVGRYVKPCWRHFWSMGWRDRHLRVHASLACGRTFAAAWLVFGMSVSTIALNVSITGQTLDRNIEEGVAKILEELGLLKTESCTLKPVCGVVPGPWGPTKFDDPWMRCPTCRGYVKPCWRHFFGSMGA
jgi:hypothetical protein